jgi:hypothetical protein
LLIQHMPVFPKKILRVAFLMVAITASVADGTHTHTASRATVGSVTFPVSCSRKAQAHIERGLAMFHSFLFDDADLQFKTAANMHSGCAMAYWAKAIGLYRPLAYQPSAPIHVFTVERKSAVAASQTAIISQARSSQAASAL